MKLKGKSNKKVRKRDEKQKNIESGITSLQHKHNLNLRLKNHIQQ